MQRTYPRCVCDNRFLVMSEFWELVVGHITYMTSSNELSSL